MHSCPGDGRTAVKHRGGTPHPDGDPGPAVAKRERGRRPAAGATPATADNGRTDPVTAVNGKNRETRRLRGEGVPGQ